MADQIKKVSYFFVVVSVNLDEVVVVAALGLRITSLLLLLKFENMLMLWIQSSRKRQRFWLTSASLSELPYKRCSSGYGYMQLAYLMLE